MRPHTRNARITGAALVVLAAMAAAPALGSGPDPTFGNDGRADLSNLRFFAKEGSAAVEKGEDSIFLTSSRGSISRLSLDGAADVSFGRGGYQGTVIYVPKIRGGVYAPAMAIQEDGKALVAGSYGPRPFLSRITAEGALDPSFSKDGSIIYRKIFGGPRGWLTDVEIDAKGRILVTGALRARSKGRAVTRAFIRRYLPSGKLDRSFGKKGRVLFKGGRSGWTYFYGLEITMRGRVVVLRSNARGTAAIAFSPSGKLLPRFAGRKSVLELPHAAYLDSVPGGRIVAFGVSPGENPTEVSNGCARIYAFNWAGVRSKGFSNDGIRNLCPRKLPDMFNSFAESRPRGVYKSDFAVQGDGKPVVALALFRGAGYEPQATMRFRLDGSIDRSFAENGLFRSQNAVGGMPLEGLDDGVLVTAGLTVDPVRPPEPGVYRFRP